MTERMSGRRIEKLQNSPSNNFLKSSLKNARFKAFVKTRKKERAWKNLKKIFFNYLYLL